MYEFVSQSALLGALAGFVFSILWFKYYKKKIIERDPTGFGALPIFYIGIMLPLCLVGGAILFIAVALATRLM